MRLFSCPNCRQRLYFENSQCLACGMEVLFRPEEAGFVLAGETAFACINAAECGCNWAGQEDKSGYCLACSMNKTIPDLSIVGNRERWERVEAAKRRVAHALLGLGLPVGPKASPDDEVGIAFDFLADQPGGGPGGERILTGHDNGLITLNVAEADSAERERMRSEMGESYRTLLGHFRHELGHYYWDRLIRDDPSELEAFRALFGDERADYANALEAHYAGGPPAGWQQRHISAYAASHPWEDWAESWAHYLHIVDTLEMAEAYHIPLAAETGGDLAETADGTPPPAGNDNGGRVAALEGADMGFDRLMRRWLALSEAANQLNRCMGLPDLYPFVITDEVARKLHFVRQVIGAHGH